ncbi:MAG: tetratricopeptide repeat protein [Pseudomonadota bacterium]
MHTHSPLGATLTRAIAAFLSLIAAESLAHDASASHTATSAPLIDRAGETIPAHLIAAVCGMPGRTGDQGFERRLELAEFLLAKAERAESDPAPARTPLLEGMGAYHREITTDQPLAQRYFDQGLLLTYAFNHPEAVASFREARRIDPGCALCWWGEAYALGPNINAAMDPEAATPAIEALAHAQAAADGATPVERALIAAMSSRYDDSPQADQGELNQRFARAMEEVAERFPKDADVLAIYADALMNTQPWDYWEADGRTLHPSLEALVPTLEASLALDPDNPMAIHLYIHAVEASNRPELAAPHADKLVTAAPGAGHLVHMPSHLYIRLGRFRDSIKVNRLAMVADEAYLAQKDEDTPYRYTYYPHNVHFVLESARLIGDRASALAAAEKLGGLTDLEMSLTLPWVQLMDAAPYFAHAQFSAPEDVLALAPPNESLVYVTGAWHYARAHALTALGRRDEARAEVASIREIARMHDWETLLPDTPGEALLNLAAYVIEGRLMRTTGNPEGAIDAYSKAVALQDELPYLEPAMWYYPVRQSLGAALVEAQRPEEAVEVFKRALARDPEQALMLFGLAEALAAAGMTGESARVTTRFAQRWAGSTDNTPVLADL